MSFVDEDGKGEEVKLFMYVDIAFGVRKGGMRQILSRVYGYVNCNLRNTGDFRLLDGGKQKTGREPYQTHFHFL